MYEINKLNSFCQKYPKITLSLSTHKMKSSILPACKVINGTSAKQLCYSSDIFFKSDTLHMTIKNQLTKVNFYTLLSNVKHLFERKTALIKTPCFFIFASMIATTSPTQKWPYHCLLLTACIFHV